MTTSWVNTLQTQGQCGLCLKHSTSSQHARHQGCNSCGAYWLTMSYTEPTAEPHYQVWKAAWNGTKFLY